MDLNEIKELIEIVAEKGFSEFELQKGGFKLRLCFTNGVEHVASAPTPVAKAAAAPKPALPPAPKPAEATAPAPAPAAAPKSEKELHKIKAPIVGTFYRAPSPTSEAFVKQGSRVSPGTVLCIIEAMKLMNEIEADISGEIVEIYVENGQPVEYGQPLFGIKVD